MTVESDPWGTSADYDKIGRLKEGMPVLDASGNDIGKVGYIQMADPNSATVEPGVDQSVFDDRTVFTDIGDDDGHVTERMRQTGYFKLDQKGLFSSDKYITPEMIDSVSEGVVRLRYDKDNIPDPG